jgi:hypothetical protein
MIFTRAACTYGFALKHLLGVVAGACLCWFVGGLAGMGLAALSPEFFQHHFVRVPEDWNEMLGYAWAGGSILGLQAGGFVSLVLSLVLLRMNWRRGAGM